jgi:hypothetical protein
MNAHRMLVAALLLVGTSGFAHAQVKPSVQGAGGRGVLIAEAGKWLKVSESAPLEVSPVKNAPFLADAVTEFTQILGDGNRIEHRYVSSIARDSRGRTRREEQIALVGPLAAAGAAPRLVTILDPGAGLTYTLDEAQQVAFRNRVAEGAVAAKLVELQKALQATRVREPGVDPSASQGVTEALGSRLIDGVKAEGTRTTTTVPAGAIGNVLPIDIVSERWFSAELQMPVLISRNDPRSGETVYRLVNIVRAEPADALFTIPSGYEVRDGTLAFRLVEKAKKVQFPKK